MSYMAFLGQLGVLYEIEVTFSRVRDTQSNIDEAFSTKSRDLESNDDITLTDLREQMSKC